MLTKKNIITSLFAGTLALTGLGIPPEYGAISSAHASPVGGTQGCVDLAPPLAREMYSITLRAGELTTVELLGDGSSDLDLFLYDEHGNLIDQDLGLSDHATVGVRPRWTGTFVIVVANLGAESNLFQLVAR